ncbi:MAG: FtsX-like permease family protein [Aggregatilineales bacterium]
MIGGALGRVAIRSALRRPLQSALFIVGVALGVALVVAIDLANGSAARGFTLFTESIAGRATHIIDGGPSGLPDSVYAHIRVDLGFQDAAPIVDDYVQALEMDEQPLHVFGIDPFAEPPFRNYLSTNAAGVPVAQLTAFLTQPNTALIAETLADHYRLQAGDTLTLRYGATRHTVTLVGLLRSDDAVTEQGLQGLLITDISTAQELLGRVGKLTAIDLIIPDNAAGAATLDQIKAFLPPGAAIQTAGAQGSAVGQITGAFNLSLTALSLLALVVGMFLIYNTVTFSVVQRRPVIGTLRALGVTRAQIFGMLLAEAAILGTIGAVIGLALGVIMGRLAVGVVTQTVSSLFFTVTVRSVSVPPLTLVKGAVIGVGAALLAALVPAYEATTTPPSGALQRSNIEAKVRRAIPALTVIGVILLILAALLMSIHTLGLNFAGLFALLIGCALFTPLVVLALMSALRPLLGATIGPLGRIAPRSIIRSLSRTSVAVAALMVAVSVIVGVNAMVGSFRGTVQDWLQTTIRADILVGPPSISANRQDVPVDPSVAGEIAAIPGVASLSVSRDVEVPVVGSDLPAELNAITIDISQGQRRFAWAIGNFDVVWQAQGNGSVVVTESFAVNRGLPIGPGGSITLRTDRGPHTFPIVGVAYDYGSTQGVILMADNVYRQLWDDKSISTVAVWITPGADIQTVIAAIRSHFAGREELVVQSNRELLQSVLVIFDQTFAITTALSLLATVVAFIGILSALMALQLERTRELGTLRANGLTRGQLFRMTLIETGLMGLTAGVMAIPVGTALAWVLVYIINARSFGWSITLGLRPEFYTQAVIVALGAALLAGIYPAIRMGRIQPAQALRTE